MAWQTHATRWQSRRAPLTLTDSENSDAPMPLTAAGLIARVKAIFADRSDNRVAQLFTGKVFLLRIASALIALASQVFLARWMGRVEFGIYIYVWTWVLMIGSLSDMGLSLAARHFIPEYTKLGEPDWLRGFLIGSRWLVLALATGIGLIGALGVTLLKPWLDGFTVIPLYLGCAVLPMAGLSGLQTGIAQSYNRPILALAPFYIWRQVALTLLMGAVWLVGLPTNAVTAMIVAIVTTWAVTAGQTLLLNRQLARAVPRGRKSYAPATWLTISLPILVVEGFYLMLTYVDIITLEHYCSPAEVAVYYAATRILAVIAFVYFAVAGATTHKFTAYHVAGDYQRLAKFFGETIRWTFWPSLATCAAILVIGRPLLSLFGASFTSGYPVMFILAVGMLARAAVGPAERLLNMLGERKQCAGVYALAFVVNLGLCILLIPRMGIAGAAVATSIALVVESLILYFITRQQLGYYIFLMRHAEH